MSALSKSFIVGLVVIGSSMPCLAQQNQTLEKPSTRKSDQSEDQLSEFLAGQLMMANYCVVELSKMAEEKASSQDVKQLARELKEAHTTLNKKLSDSAPKVAATLKQGRQSRRASTRQNGERSQNAPRGQKNAGSNTSMSTLDRLCEIQKEASMNHHDAAMMALKEQQGQDFDMAYLGFQIGGHMWMIAQLDAIANADVSSECQTMAKQAKSSMEGHLQKAKQLARNLEDDRSPQKTTQR